MNDAMNIAVNQGQQVFPRARLIGAGEVIGVVDEWVQFLTLNPQQATGSIRLRSGAGQFLLVDSEPFYVSGLQEFILDTGAGALVQTAPRREMLTGLGAGRDYPANGAGASEAYEFDGAIGFLTAATNWWYLGADLQWYQEVIGNTSQGMPFGKNSPNKDIAGRYYEIATRFTVDVGAPTMYIVHEMGVGRPLIQASATGTPNHSNVRIGDTNFNLGGTAPYSYLQTLGSPLWTIAFQNNVNATFTANIKVTRQGF